MPFNTHLSFFLLGESQMTYELTPKTIGVEEIIASCHNVAKEDLAEAKRLVEEIQAQKEWFIETKNELNSILKSSFSNISKTLPYKPKKRGRYERLELVPKTSKNIPKKSLEVFVSIQEDLNKLLWHLQNAYGSYDCITQKEAYSDYDAMIYNYHILDRNCGSRTNFIAVRWSSEMLLYTLANTKTTLEALKKILTMTQEKQKIATGYMAKIKDVLIAYQ